MAEDAGQKPSQLTRFAAKASLAMFAIAAACLILAIVARLLSGLGVFALILPPVGLLTGAIALLGGLTARIRDILAAFTGMAMNGVLFMGFIYYDVIYPSHCCHPESACIANLKQIEGAKLTWALEFKKTTNDIPADSDLFGTNAYMRIKPCCPQNGTYQIGAVAQPVRCSIPGHTL